MGDVLIWINGPFGGGKTQTAHELHRRLPGSVICDPELVGFGLHRMLPRHLRHDFQDLTAWRQGVVEVLDLVLSTSGATVIAPMTVVETRYFDETVGELRRRGHDVRHTALLAERDTVLRRLRERGPGHVLNAALHRGGGLRRENFAVSHLDHCLARLAEPEFAAHLHTDHRSLAEVAKHIATLAGLTLLPDTDGPLRRRLRRAWVGARHIRFD